MPDSSLLIHGGTVLTMDERMRVLSPGYVLTRGERIAQVETGHPPAYLLDTVDCVVDASGQSVLPGLINAHTHLYQSFLKGLNDRLDLVEWCAEVLFPVVDVIRGTHSEENDERTGYHYALLGAIEMIRGGITCCVDMDIVTDSIFEAWQEIGLRGVGALTLSNQWVPPRLQRDEELLRSETVDWVKRWHAAHLNLRSPTPCWRLPHRFWPRAICWSGRESMPWRSMWESRCTSRRPDMRWKR